MGATHVDAGKETKTCWNLWRTFEALSRRGRSISFEYCYWGWVMDSSFWPWRKTTEHGIQAHFISSLKKIQNNAVCWQDSFDCFLGLTKSLHDRIFGSWEDRQFSSVHWNNKKTYGGGCVELGGQHRGFCCCMTMQDRTLLAQRLMLWRRWSLRFSSIRPTALTWRQAISIFFSPQEGSQGESFHLRWWSEASCDVVDQTKNSWILHWRHA